MIVNVIDFRIYVSGYGQIDKNTGFALQCFFHHVYFMATNNKVEAAKSRDDHRFRECL